MSGLKFATKYRSGLEERMARQLKDAGVKSHFEKVRIEYVVPQRTAKYIPDFTTEGSTIILEGKGRFGGKYGNDAAKERQKLILVKEQHPDLDIRIVFTDANKKLYKGSKTTYAKWADDNGFKWSTKGVIPDEWLEELKGTFKYGNRDATTILIRPG
jgi:hypothetical protein